MRVAYVGSFLFPEGDASAARVLGLGRVLRELGHDVDFFGIERSPQGKGRAPVVSMYDGFRYVSPAPARSGLTGKLARLIGIISGSSVLCRVDSADRVAPFDAVIAYQSPSALIFRLRRWCDSRNIPLICDTAEWYDREHVPAGKYGPLALDSELRMRKAQTLADGVITISRLLEGYYAKRGMLTCRIPPLVDLRAPKWQAVHDLQQERGGLTLAFVGNAGKKDFLVNAIRGMAQLGDTIQQCTLSIVGPSEQEVRTALGGDSLVLDQHPHCFHFTGRLTHTEALQVLAKADFTILLRQDARYAHAGFPTKLVESFSMGIPVIGNLTGDVGDYLTGSEGIILPSHSPESFAAGVKKALRLTCSEKRAMRCSARARAEQSFDFRNWIVTVERFLTEVAAPSKKHKVANGAVSKEAE